MAVWPRWSPTAPCMCRSRPLTRSTSTGRPSPMPPGPAEPARCSSPGEGEALYIWKGLDERRLEMPVAKIHILDGQYDDARLGKVSSAVHDGLIRALGIPPDDFFQIIHVLPRSQFRHTSSFLD